MKVAVEREDVERFSGFVTRRLGLHLDDTKLGELAHVLRRMADASGCPPGAFLDRAHAERDGSALRAIAAELTVPETYFFRHNDQLRAFAEVALPARMKARHDTRQLRILSAGCATGEEPYSLAIILRETMLDPSWKVSIVGADVNRAALDKAVRARFSRWALRETSEDRQRRWFRRTGTELLVDDEIRSSVAFEERNLVDVAHDAWPDGAYDVVFWRNVMMYFTPEHARAVVTRLTRALAPGGYLFLGHAETLRRVSHDYHLRHTHDAFYYERKLAHDARDGTERAYAPCERAAATSAAAPPAEPSGREAWVHAIDGASQRISALADRSRDPTSPVPHGAMPVWSLAGALGLLEAERFADALSVLETLPTESALDPHVLLLRAVLLTHSGDLARAAHVCRELLAVDELDAGAHYLLALCCEGTGDIRGAADHDQQAIRLDPAFAMPRLHLGLISRRAQDREGARRDLGKALVLLEREDRSRLLLFGGGFGREALVSLCRAELIACGGTP